jgi:hydrocephalus-inducing protein
LEVSLAAKGVGTTLYCKQDMKSIDFGTEYTHKMVPKQFFLENRGRKQMKITWVRQVKPQKKNDKEKADDAKKK